MSRSSNPRILIHKGSTESSVIELNESTTTFGRSPDNDVAFSESTVSAVHARIIREGDQFRIIDIHSKNGTFVNAIQLTHQGKVLREGDHVTLGRQTVEMGFTAKANAAIPTTTTEIESPDVCVDTRARSVQINGALLVPPLSRKEFDVLSCLYQRKGEACTRDEIATFAWPDEHGEGIFNDTIDKHISHIRLRIEPDPPHWQFIRTERGFGYKLT